MKTVIDEKNAQSKRDKPYSRDLEIDKNMVIVNNPTMFTVGTSFEQHPPYPKLGNRVIHTNNHNPNVPFGQIGTVTGIYKNKIEVMFDEAFIGATDLFGRCDFFRGGMLNFHDIFNLSEWKNYVNTKKHIREQVKNLYYKKQRGERFDPHEQMKEWDGKIDGFLLISQMMKIKQDMHHLQMKPDQPRTQPKLKGASEAYKGGYDDQPQRSYNEPRNQGPKQGGFSGAGNNYAPQYPTPGPSSQPFYPSSSARDQGRGYQQQQFPPYQQSSYTNAPFVPVPPPQLSQEAKFETNPKHKLKSSKAKREEEGDYVAKGPQNPPQSQKQGKREDSSELEYRPKAVPAKTSQPFNAEELEKKMSTPAQIPVQQKTPQPVDLADIEAQMMASHNKK